MIYISGNKSINMINTIIDYYNNTKLICGDKYDNFNYEELRQIFGIKDEEFNNLLTNNNELNYLSKNSLDTIDKILATKNDESNKRKIMHGIMYYTKEKNMLKKLIEIKNKNDEIDSDDLKIIVDFKNKYGIKASDLGDYFNIDHNLIIRKESSDKYIERKKRK